ncbi:hypothetical protein C2845_PM03G21340 [Panicum miliaceum]|uniref:Uncharacterized protein n=1 Tax=Panicum miliaceum TaxID=4540 RepID=A0A3L6T6V1_PANMI|nr:hypothetical protein C2845_PM03G21340 [Panicum miliaceum]
MASGDYPPWINPGCAFRLVVKVSRYVVDENLDEDGLATQLVDEDHVYEAMGFKEAEEIEEEGGGQEVSIPAISTEMQEDMNGAAVNVDDTADEEPLYEWTGTIVI